MKKCPDCRGSGIKIKDLQKKQSKNCKTCKGKGTISTSSNFGIKLAIAVIAMVVIMGLGSLLFSPSNEYLFGEGPESLKPDPYLLHLDKAKKAETCNNVSCESDALNHYKMALEINPEGRGALDGILSELISLNKFEEAYKYYQTITKLYPEKNFVETIHAVPMFLGLKQYEEALSSSEDYLKRIDEKKLEFAFEYSLALRDKSRALIGLDRFEEAILIIDESFELRPSGDTLLYKGIALSKQGKYNEALEVFDKISKEGTEGILFDLERGIALWNISRHEEAKKILDNIENSPESDKFLNNEILDAKERLRNLINESGQ